MSLILLVWLASVGAAPPVGAEAALEAESESAVEADAAPGGGEAQREDSATAAPPEYTAVVMTRQARVRTASSTTLGALELAATPRRNAEELLRLVPGLTLVQHGSEGKGHQFFLRGFDAVHGADLEVTVDGLPVNEWSNVHAQGYLDLGFIIPEVVRAVEVTKGPFALDQGAFALAGTVDYRLGVAEPERGLRLGYSAGSTNRQRGVVTFSPAAADGDSFIAAEALHDDGFGPSRRLDRAALLGRLRLVDSPAAGALTLLASAYVADFALPGTLRDEALAAGELGFFDVHARGGAGRSERALLAATHRWQRGGRALHTTVALGYRRLALRENYTGYLLDPIAGDWRRQRQQGWQLVAASSWEQQLAESLALQLGAGVRGDRLGQSQAQVDAAGVTLARERAAAVLQALAHGLAGLRWRPHPRLRLVAGARLDVARSAVEDRLAGGRRGDGTVLAISPRLTGDWRVADGWRLFAAYGRGLRPPEARAFTRFAPERVGLAANLYRGGEPTMTRSDTGELGLQWLPHAAWALRLSGFATAIERESIFDHVSGVNLELNSTRRLGGELELEAKPAAWLTVAGHLTAVDARFVRSGEPIPLVPRLVGGVRAVATHPSGLRLGLWGVALAPRPLPHGARGAPLATFDLTAGYDAGRWRLDLEVENVLNRRLREGEYHYASHWRPGEEPSELPVLHVAAGPPLNARVGLSILF